MNPADEGKGSVAAAPAGLEERFLAGGAWERDDAILKETNQQCEQEDKVVSRSSNLAPSAHAPE